MAATFTADAILRMLATGVVASVAQSADFCASLRELGSA